MNNFKYGIRSVSSLYLDWSSKTLCSIQEKEKRQHWECKHASCKQQETKAKLNVGECDQYQYITSLRSLIYWPITQQRQLDKFNMFRETAIQRSWVWKSNSIHLFFFSAVVVSLTPTHQQQFQAVQVARTDTGETIQILSTDQHGNIIAAAAGKKFYLNARSSWSWKTFFPLGKTAIGIIKLSDIKCSYLFLEPTVLMAPVTQNAKASVPVQPVLDANETKQWWQLEEVVIMNYLLRIAFQCLYPEILHL